MPAAHILTYARDLRGGGVERALLRLADGWTAAGRRVTLVLGDAGGPLATALPAAVEVVEIGDTSMRRLLGAVPLDVRARRPDLIFCPGNHYTSVAAWTRARLGGACPPIVAKMSNAVRRGDHGAVLDAAHRAWLRLHARFFDHLVAMTPATAAEAARATGMTGRTSVIPNPPPMQALHAERLPLPDGPFILGVGRLARQKRWDRLIAAMPALAGVPVVVLGEGDERGSLLAQATALGVAERLHLPGHAADPLAAMARAAVLALPSDFEGAPGVLREALSVGTPVVATDSSPSVREIVWDRTLGTVVARDDAAGLVAALRWWLTAARPEPVPMPGKDAAARYLALFDRLVDGAACQSP
ncbi:MAG: glycosyltransferase [Sphingomonas bacterium]|uniref:glycosyltransferase n=1 Tax=Sphingomonas bacterium TaxID=1895847 RepID=UPI002614E24F|nr:glycosyltransferase [Sphingomonas bacterium]MDB5694494.1 glycosyltransferase [Sphingomonas bacterium]